MSIIIYQNRLTEADALVKTGYNPELKLEGSSSGCILTINLSSDFNKTPRFLVNSALVLIWYKLQIFTIRRNH